MYPDYIPTYRVSDLVLRYPNFNRDGDIRIREGWLQLVEEMLLELKYLFPEVRVLNISARSWLSVVYEGENLLDLKRRKRLQDVVQGYVTRSLSTCEHCGSQHGVTLWEAEQLHPRFKREKWKWDRPICQECVPALNHAALRTMDAMGIQNVQH